MFRLISAVLFSLALALPSAAAGIDETLREVEDLRGLKFRKPVRQKTISRAELTPFLQKEMERDLPVRPDEFIEILRALGFLTDEKEPMKRLLALYEAQVLAFYDPRTGIYYSLDAPPKGVSAEMLPTDAIAVHELVHALQDQHFEAGKRMLERRENWDASMAYQALIEGEATLVMMKSLFEGLGVDFDEATKNANFATLLASATAMSGVPADAPKYFVDSMSFPYFAGLQYVLEAYRAGGWEAVNSLHRNPPRSTEEVLHPGTSSGGAAKRAKSPGAILSTTVGEFHWKYLLGEQAAEGWGSDQVDVFRTGRQWTVVGTTAWDSVKDAEEFATALRTKLDGKEAAAFNATGTTVRFGWGADRARIAKAAGKQASR